MASTEDVNADVEAGVGDAVDVGAGVTSVAAVGAGVEQQVLTRVRVSALELMVVVSLWSSVHGANRHHTRTLSEGRSQLVGHTTS